MCDIRINANVYLNQILELKKWISQIQRPNKRWFDMRVCAMEFS